MASVEERNFTKAEMKMFAQKYEAFQAAQKVVDEFVVFLREQHEIPDGEEGWQIGQNGFFRMDKDVPAASDAVIDVPPGKIKREND